VIDGRARFAGHHVRRLTRDARALGIGDASPESVYAAFEELGHAEFGTGAGIVRVQAVRDESHGLQLVGIPRELGEEPDTWRAVSAPFPHMGPQARGGAKVSHQAVYDRARAFSDEQGVDEALLFDAQGWLVEGARTNLVIVTRDEELAGPYLRLGAVAGITRQILHERVDVLVEREIDAKAVAECSELIAVNAVRGACPITSLDGVAVGPGSAGPWSERLNETLSQDLESPRAIADSAG
jgi:branched-subunit amino acid aminotransferase/4-amino-4-deoxychorismate lyase